MEFVTFEVAKKLKDFGYSTPFFFFYRTDDQLIHHAMVGKPLVYGENVDNEVVIAPTISQVLKWLREEKGIHIALGYSGETKWCYVIIYVNEAYFDKPNLTVKRFDSYEQAALAGIEYTLNKRFNK